MDRFRLTELMSPAWSPYDFDKQCWHCICETSRRSSVGRRGKVSLGQPQDIMKRLYMFRTFRTNTISQYHLTSLFIPPLLSHPLGGTIVTISSILSKLGASHLSAYTASKAALIAYHASITAELSAHPKIKTILVTPGQLSTEMFSNVQQGPVANFFGPVVEVQDLAMEIVRMIDQGKGGLIALPTYARWISCLDILPVGLQKLFRDLAGVDAAMARGSLLAEEAAAETSQVEVTDAEQEDSIVFVEKSK